MRLCGIVVLAGLLVGAAIRADESLVNMILAIVNDTVITLNEVKLKGALQLESLERMYYNRPAQLDQEVRKLMEEALEDLVAQELILSDYKTSGLQIPEAIIDDEIKRQIREGYGDRAKLTKALQRRGQTFEDYRKSVRERYVSVLMRQRNVNTALIMSPAKIERYYQQHTTNYAVGEQMKIRAIVRSVPEPDASPEVRKLMLEIENKMTAASNPQGGTITATFSEMASLYSEGSQSQQGGDWGWQERTYWMAGLSDIAAQLTPGQSSGLVGVQREGGSFPYTVSLYDSAGRLQKLRTYDRNPTTGKEQLLQEVSADGQQPPGTLEPKEYYLILVEAKRPARTKPLAEVQDEIEKELLRNETRRLEKKWIDRLRAKSFVRYF